MKQLLLFLIFSTFHAVSAQVPVNDLIQNATLIDESPFVDANIRLDLASVGDGGQNGCDLGTGYKLVYYKFTSTSNDNITITIEDGHGFDIGQTFAIIYSATDLNATSDSQLTNVSTCTFGTTTNFTTITGTSYYILVHRINGGTVWTNVTIDTPLDVSASERSALVDLYNDTDGANWTNNTNWTSSNPASTFYGVTVKNGHVSKLTLNANNLNGTIASIANLPYLEEINFSSNLLSGNIPDLSGISTLTSINVSNNNFLFQDIETNYTNNSSISSYTYTPQNKTDVEDSFDGVIGDDYTLTMSTVSGTNVQYQWYKKRYNYFDESDELIVGETNNSYTITGLMDDDMDIYICRATSTIITDLTIERNSIEIKGEVSQLQKDALIAIYISTNGGSWNDNTNWLSTEPVSEWYGVTVTGNKVTQLIFDGNNLTGTLPSEIGDLTGLEYLSFYSGNSINGTLPPEIGNLTELRVISFEQNNFTGEIPTSYSNLTKLRGFWLWDNQLTGTIPEFLNTFQNLVFIDISENNFSGTLPDFSGLPILTYLSIGRNHFLPNDFSNQFNDYLNLQNNWTNSYYYSPQYTLDVEETIDATEGDDIVLTLTDVPATSRSTSNSFTANNYQWFKDNVAISGADANSYTIINSQTTDSGIYYCEITNPDMPDLIIRRENITVNIGVLSIDDEFLNVANVYPNPTKDILKINLINTIDAEVYLYDIQGRLILNKDINTEVSTLNTSHLHSGVYILSIKTDIATVSKKIIKE